MLGFKGADKLEIDAQGDLVLHAPGGVIRQQAPVIYQEIDGVRTEIEGGYVLKGANRVGFKLAAYDASQPLVIDPTLFYSTYLGGGGSDQGRGIAVDPAGNAYVAGLTTSSDFPTTAGAVGTTFNGGDFDAFVTKLNPTGSALLYSTYLGGGGDDQGFGIAVDTAGNAYAAGATDSRNFPTTAQAFDKMFNGGDFDAFVTKLDPTGSALFYSTYLGGISFDIGLGIAVDAMPSPNAYVTGFTESADFPATPGAADTTFNGDIEDAFVTKLDPTGSMLLYSTYLGGSGFDQGLGIAVDTAGSAYVTGITFSGNFPTTAGAVDTTLDGSFDAFVTKLEPAGSMLLYSTYLGGSGFDQGFGIAVDAMPSPNAYVTGFTGSADFPTTAGAFDTMFNGLVDAFVAKIVDVVLPPPPTVGKVTGGGTINVVAGIGNFGFIVQRQAVDGSIHGQLQYVNHATKAEVHSEMFTTFVVTGNRATFGGMCTSRVNGSATPCTFTVDVTDNGEPGTTDTFVISVTPGTTDGGTLREGNIQIHE